MGNFCDNKSHVRELDLDVVSKVELSIANDPADKVHVTAKECRTKLTDFESSYPFCRIRLEDYMGKVKQQVI